MPGKISIFTIPSGSVRRVSTVFFCIFLLAAGRGHAQTETVLQRSLKLYGEGRYQELLQNLKPYYEEQKDPAVQAEVLYWISLAELGAADYERAFQDMEVLEKLGGTRAAEIPYHKGRVCYYLGRYDEGISLLSAFAENLSDPGDPRKSAALYWIGESLYSMGQMEKAKDIFSTITENYPSSAKFEAASYRISLINQKKIETELLALLKWSHEESLKTIEEYQRRERAYDQAIIAYQKRIADMLRESPSSGSEAAVQDRQQPSQAQERGPETGTVPSASLPGVSPSSPGGGDRGMRLNSIKSQALELQNQLEKSLGTDSGDL
ncbi:MAG: tetratricopeptide repeat protein [Treponema sp.]|jgi:tetratricopeptide (TPR) repeat protein|nr:tetratricopeptide repeat protein [Treponema sp.]